MNNQDKLLISYLNHKISHQNDYLDFNHVTMDYSTHKYHSYPATMIPKLPELFINAVQSVVPVGSLYDPFMGSGTTLVEGIRHNINSTGIDLNPLAVLISRVKTRKLDSTKLAKQATKLFDNIDQAKALVNNDKLVINIPKFNHIDYWFKPEVIIDLELIKEQINKVKDTSTREFFLLAFSSTVRYVSNTRNSEFKLYRMAPEKLAKWHPDTVAKFKEYVQHNVNRNKLLKTTQARASVYFSNSQDAHQLADNTFDLLITSPPYGDSQTTVAYGQFSRISLQWLGLKEYSINEITKIDKSLLGGTVFNKEFKALPSPTFNNLIRKLDKIDHKRALEVAQFYDDLFLVLKENVRVMTPNSYQFWVTANRTVKRIQLPTDKIITELYNSLNVKRLASYVRNIPNKRMPVKNSPTNQQGKVANTMQQEKITLYKTVK